MGGNPTRSLTLKSENAILDSDSKHNNNIHNKYENDNIKNLENSSFFQNDYLKRSLENSMNGYNNNNIYNNYNNYYNPNRNYSRFNKLKKHNKKNNYLSNTMKNIPSQESFVRENNYSTKNNSIHPDLDDSFIMEKSYLDKNNNNNNKNKTFNLKNNYENNDNDYIQNKLNFTNHSILPHKIISKNGNNNKNYKINNNNNNNNNNLKNSFHNSMGDNPVLDPNKFLQNTQKNIIYSEYQKNINYLDNIEKTCFETIDSRSIKTARYLKYSKSILLHIGEIYCICSLTKNLSEIYYATGGADCCLKFWTMKFECIQEIKNLQLPSKSLKQYNTKFILSAEGINIKIYNIYNKNIDDVKVLKDHIDIVNEIFILRNEYVFSGGKDKVIRLWNINKFIKDQERNLINRYFEGHRNEVIKITSISSSCNTIISLSKDKEFIIWEINSGNILLKFENYFTPVCILGTNFGFCCGSFDNKIRFYNEQYEMIKCLVGNYFNVEHLLMLSNKHLMFSSDSNNIYVVDIDDDTIKTIYKGLKCRITCMMKCADFYDFEVYMKNKSKGIDYQTVLTTGNDGYVYLWECYQYNI